MLIPSNMQAVEITGNVADLFSNTLSLLASSLGADTISEITRYQSTTGSIYPSLPQAVTEGKALRLTKTSLKFKADGSLIPAKVISTADPILETKNLRYTVEIKVPNLGTVTKSDVKITKSMTLKDIFEVTNTSEPHPGAAEQVSVSFLGFAPMYEARNRYFAPITYWWADFWNVGGNWDRTAASPDCMAPAIINSGNGPGATKSDDWARQISIIRAKGMKAIGYVSTQYGKRAVADILADVEKHVEFYQVDGIFLDEMSNGSGDQAQYTQQYKDIYTTLKKNYGSAFWVVGNPGTPTTEEILSCADTVVVYESDADYYLNPQWDIHPTYYEKYPSTKFWHVVHSVRDKEQAKYVLKASEKYHPAFLCLTDLDLSSGNPYATPPSPWLWDMQVAWARHQGSSDTGWVYLSEEIPDYQDGDILRVRRADEWVSVQVSLTPREWPGEYIIELPEEWRMTDTLTICAVNGGAPTGRPTAQIGSRVSIWGATPGTSLSLGAANFRG